LAWGLVTSGAAARSAGCAGCRQINDQIAVTKADKSTHGFERFTIINERWRPRIEMYIGGVHEWYGNEHSGGNGDELFSFAHRVPFCCGVELGR